MINKLFALCLITAAGIGSTALGMKENSSPLKERTKKIKTINDENRNPLRLVISENKKREVMEWLNQQPVHPVNPHIIPYGGQIPKNQAEARVLGFIDINLNN